MRRLFIFLLMVCGWPVSAALAQSIRPVDDEVLAAQRGRYIADGKIIGFGLQMATRWQATDGSTRQADLSVAADLRAGRVSITTSAVDNSGQGAGSNRAAGPAVSGALQSVQVAGYGNNVGNTMDVQVSRDRIVVEPGASTASARSGGAIAEQTDPLASMVAEPAPSIGRKQASCRLHRGQNADSHQTKP